MISVITPTHDGRFLLDAWESLQAQSVSDWEWILVPNGAAAIPDAIRQDARVRVCPHDKASIGALKRFACEQARGEIVVEFDHDDLLTPDALAEVQEALEGADFVYSNHAEFIDGTWAPYTYDASYGWEYRPFECYGHAFTEIVSFAPTGHSLSLVHYAPDHLRAWRAKAYWDIGGHDVALPICDDHDLCVRFYLSHTVKHIDKCLYLYRRHKAQTFVQSETNALIQKTTREVQARYIYRLADRWARLQGLPRVDLGTAHSEKPVGFIGVDQVPYPGVDHVCDVSKGLPFEDHSVGLIRAVDFLEHIPDKVGMMNEIWRVLCDGGWLLSRTPSTDGRGAFQDPTHVAYYNEHSFWYYTNRDYARYVPDIRCRFQAVRLATDFPTDWHKANKIPYVYADLAAVKTWRRRPGRITI